MAFFVFFFFNNLKHGSYYHRGIVAGFAHLHSKGFVYPDLKPSDVLMVGLCPKLSGSCYRLDEDTLLTQHYDADISCALGISDSNSDDGLNGN